ncbi:MAG: transglycosylase domain-containing protein [Candidatus Moraniibacteriota bacterium]
MSKLFSFLHWLARQTSWLVLILSLGLVVGGFSIYFFDAAETLDLDAHPLAETTILFDRTGKHVLYEVHGEENRRVIAHAEIPETIRQATIAAEDAHFFTHPGVDVIAILRAAIVNVRHQGISQGASTITQQLARALFLTREKTWIRKVREIVLAIKIERSLSKEEILDLYLNTVPYGSNAYGIEAAAQTFFGKRAGELTLDEAALVAALPNAPTLYSPYGKNQKALVTRKESILRKMHELGSISAADLETALATKTLEKVVTLERKIRAPHFVFYILEQLKQEYGQAALETEGYDVFTSIDLDLQERAESVVADGVKKNLPRGATNGALVAITPKNGEILAMVGSRDYFDTKIDGQVNVAVEKRQPGSTFKPFAYATAFTKGFTPETRIYDVPINFGADGTGVEYIPSNYDGHFRGLITMRSALSQSLNIPAVSTLYLAGIPETIALATSMGITTLTEPSRYGLALVLGGAEVKLIDLTSAFGVFGQEGKRVPTDGILRVVDREDRDVYKRITHSDAVIGANITNQISSILSDNAARAPVFGSSSPIAFPAGTGVAAKTGTTQNFRDAWTVGYTRDVALGVWTGNNDNTAMEAGSDGIYTAAPMWRSMMDTLLDHYPPTPFSPYTDEVASGTSGPSDVVSGEPKIVYYDKKSGKKISAEKAKKKRQSEIEVRIVDGGMTFKYSKEKGSDNLLFKPSTAEDLLKIYYPNGN